eukprot:749858-Hanusia_phi.AAC.1
MREKAEKKLAALRHNLQVGGGERGEGRGRANGRGGGGGRDGGWSGERSEEECASLDAILAHVRAVLHMYIDSPQNLDSVSFLLLLLLFLLILPPLPASTTSSSSLPLSTCSSSPNLCRSAQALAPSHQPGRCRGRELKGSHQEETGGRGSYERRREAEGSGGCKQLELTNVNELAKRQQL